MIYSRITKAVIQTKYTLRGILPVTSTVAAVVVAVFAVSICCYVSNNKYIIFIEIMIY